MLIKDIPEADLRGFLRGTGIHLDTGAFTTRLRAHSADLSRSLAEVYADYPIETEPTIDDFQVVVGRASGWRGLFGREQKAHIEDGPGLPPFAADFAFPILESMLNWCIVKRVYRYVTFHAGAVERDGRSVILTGPSGAGKSTLCAALAHSGWRLLSDELALLRTDIPEVVANPRPISLKNEAIARVAELASGARFSRPYHGTVKGTIRFVCPPPQAVAAAKTGARPHLVIAPSFSPDGACKLEPMSKAQGFMYLIRNSVNYFATMKTGFEAVANTVDLCEFYRLSYGDLDDAMAMIDRLHQARMKGERAA